jgi:hypothetical protein
MDTDGTLGSITPSAAAEAAIIHHRHLPSSKEAAKVDPPRVAMHLPILTLAQGR